MKILFISTILAIFSCDNRENGNTQNSGGTDSGYYVNLTIDGKELDFAADDISTDYRVFDTHHEFKIYAGGEYGQPSLTLTVIADMSKPSSTPNGDPVPANPLFQGSVSLQNYPENGLAFNNYDGLRTVKAKPVPDAIIIKTSEPEPGGKARIISGTLNTVVLGGENKTNDPAVKDYAVKGSFRVRHKFDGNKF
ncbi:hypothetical protein LAG90_09295 [Marinilongibacter aquaticus]|uniref:hypothetical protein n=1 Tax=Marinilongibacter aquaticus TaxID=2975157 RepID=UPI0021BDEC9A|nr:hypothetical protein [Marinilongibacter aquaticus]UBM60830.1 hypothetical protein LAG90_09295 [Marinilongibacter aquaticus]